MNTELREKYKKETGEVDWDYNTQSYNNEYVEWLEQQVSKLPIHGVSNSVIQEIERRRDLILSEPDGLVREQMIRNLALDL